MNPPTSVDAATAAPRWPAWPARRVDASTAALSRVVGVGLSKDLPELQGRLDFRLATATAHEGPPACCLALHGQAGTLLLADGLRWILALTGVALDAAPSDPGLTAWLHESAAAALPEAWGSTFSQIEPDPALLNAGTPNLGALDPPKPAGPWCALQLSLRTEDHRLTTHAWALADTWQVWLAQSTSGVLRWQPVFELAHLCRPAVVARHVLPRGRVADLCAGTLILPSDGLFDVHGQGRWRIGRYAWHVTLTEQGLLMNEQDFDAPDTPDTDEENFADPDADPDAEHTLHTLDSVPLCLQFDVGMLRLSLGELARLGPGSVLEIAQRPAAGRVTVRIGGRPVGLGELVDVDGQAAVQLLHWNAAG